MRKLDNEAVEHYKSILKMVHNHNMRVMLTLFHHSLPKWALLYGGWIDPRTVSYFADFARSVRFASLFLLFPHSDSFHRLCTCNSTTCFAIQSTVLTMEFAIWFF